MAKKVPATKSEIMAAIAEAAGISKKQAVAAYDELLKIAYAGAKGPKGIMLPGLGKTPRPQSRDWRDDQDPCPHEGEIPPLQGREGRCPRLRQGASQDASDAGSTEPAFVFQNLKPTH